MAEAGVSGRVVISAGEASGDQHAAALVTHLREMWPGVRFSGLGGPALDGQGVELIHRMEDLAVMGFSDLLPKLGLIRATLKSLGRHLAETRPDLLITVDFPDFNLRLAAEAKKLGIPVLHYVGPQIWAWRKRRARKVQRVVDRLALIFSFEPPIWYQLAPDLKTRFVGHPLVDEFNRPESSNRPLPIPAEAEVVGLLPGSRISEIEKMLPPMLKAASIMRRERGGLHFVLPVAPGLDRSAIEPYLKGAPPGLSIVKGETRRVMRRARLLLVSSGTATLEAALAGTPMVVIYRTSALNYLIARSLVKLKHISLPNLVAGRTVVPELIQSRATPKRMAEEGLSFLENDYRYSEAINGLAEVRELVGEPGAGRKTAEMALRLIAEDRR